MIQHLALILALVGARELLAATPLFVVTAAIGLEEQATLISWDPGARPVFRPVMDAKARQFEFLFLKLQGVEVPRFSGEKLVWLENGDCLKFEKIRVVDDQVHLECGAILGEKSEPITMPILEMRMVWWQNPRRELYPLRLRQQFLEKKWTKDQLVLANGEKLEGIFESLDQEKLQLETAESKSTLKADQLALLALGNGKPLGGKPLADSYRVTTTAGDRVTLFKLNMKDSMLAGEMSPGIRVRVPLEKVAKIVNMGSTAVPLSRHSAISLQKTRWLSGAGTVVSPLVPPGVEVFTSAGIVDDGLLLDGNCALKIGKMGKYKSLLMTLGVDSTATSAGGSHLTFTSGGKAIRKPLEIDAFKTQTLLLETGGIQEILITQQTGPGGRVVISDAFLIP